MARYPHQGVTKAGDGKIICSATVAVFLTGTSTPASIYAASAGGVAVNSVTSGADTSSAPGYFIFYVDRTDYAASQEFDITISKSGFNNQTYPFIVIDNAADYLPSPSSHKISHQDGGVDEILVTGLSGLLADDQHVLDAEVLAVAEDKTKKGVAGGYPDLDGTTKVPIAQMASGAPDGTKFIRDDRTLVIPPKLSGDIVQVVNTQTGAVATGTTIIPCDDTIPQNTEGDEYMTLAITPTKATNKLLIDVVIMLGINNVMVVAVALFQDTTAGALAAISDDIPTAGRPCTIKFSHYMTTGTISATTFKVRAGPVAAATLTFNGAAGGRWFGGVAASSITITEIAV